MSHRPRWEYLRALYGHYRQADRRLQQVILNEFCAHRGYHRKHALRRLNGPPPERSKRRVRRSRSPRYGAGVVSVLAAGDPWSGRRNALLPLWMPGVRKRFRVHPEVERPLLHISACQIDRRRRARKQRRKRRLYGRPQPRPWLKHPIAIKTGSWDVRVPGFTAVDRVCHSGNSASGEFAHSLNVTDIHTGWTETRAVLGKGETAGRDALDEISTGRPFRLLGIDSDNGAEFINWPQGRKLLGGTVMTRRRRSRRSTTWMGTSCAWG